MGDEQTDYGAVVNAIREAIQQLQDALVDYEYHVTGLLPPNIGPKRGLFGIGIGADKSGRSIVFINGGRNKEGPK